MNQSHQSAPDEDADGGARRSRMFLMFTLAGESYGLAITDVTEIIGFQPVTAVPDAPPYVSGLINLRGSVIPAIDVRARFEMAPRAYDGRTCIIVVRIRDALVGLIVDTVSEVVDIELEQIEPLQSVGAAAGGGRGFIMGIAKTEDGAKLLVDASRLLFRAGLNLETASPAA